MRVQIFSAVEEFVYTSCMQNLRKLLTCDILYFAVDKRDHLGYMAFLPATTCGFDHNRHQAPVPELNIILLYLYGVVIMAN